MAMTRTEAARNLLVKLTCGGGIQGNPWCCKEVKDLAEALTGQRVPDDQAAAPPEFELVIRLGNAEMRSSEHVANALRTVAAWVQGGGESRDVRDINGNVVGRWAVIGGYPEGEDGE